MNSIQSFFRQGIRLATLWLITIMTSLSAFSGEMLLKVEEPPSGATMTGVSNIRGWALSSSGIDRIELYIDGEYKTDIPYGGGRKDVGSDYPQYPDADNSGYSMANNYSLKEAGDHVITIKAYDNDGVLEELEVPYNVTRFEDKFIKKESDIDILGATEVSINGPRSLTLRGIDVQGEKQDIRLDWQTPRQNFSLTSILSSEEATSGALDGSYTMSRMSFWYGEGAEVPTGLILDTATASTTVDGIAFSLEASGEMIVNGSQIITAMQIKISGDGLSQNVNAEDEGVILDDLGYAIRYRDSIGDHYEAILLQRGSLLIWMEHFYGDPVAGDAVIVMQWQKTLELADQGAVARQVNEPVSLSVENVQHVELASSVFHSARAILHQADR